MKVFVDKDTFIGCGTFSALYEKMHAMEKDLHRHIHLENNILFLKK